MTFKKGQSGNPKGRPPAGRTTRAALEKAIADVQRNKHRNILNHMVRRAFENDKVLIALIKKFVPDLQHVEANVDIKEIIVKWAKENESK